MSQKLEGEHIYLDAIVTAPAGRSIHAIYNQKFNETIIKNSGEYTIAIDRFRIPLDSIPIFIFDKTPNVYTISLSYNGISSGKIGLQYITTTPNATPDMPEYWYVWTFDIALRMVNNAIQQAFNTLSTLVTLPAGSLPPFFSIDYTTNILSSNAQVDFYDNTLGTPIKLFMNQRLWENFGGIPIIEIGSVTGAPSNNGEDARFIFFNTFNNIYTYGTGTHTNYYKMQSAYGFEILANWNHAKGIYFISNNIPIRTEIMPTNTQNQTINNYVNTLPVLCNFDMVYTSESIKPSILQYILNTPYKIIDLIGSKNINNLDLQIFWYDRYNNSYPLMIRPNNTLTVRFVFMKKSTYN